MTTAFAHCILYHIVLYRYLILSKIKGMKNNYRLLVVFIWINKIFSISTEELDYSYIDNVKFDGCANPNEDLDESDGCHHSKFPEDTLQQLYGPKVKQCCSNHGYTYKQNEICEVRLSISI